MFFLKLLAWLFNGFSDINNGRKIWIAPFYYGSLQSIKYSNAIYILSGGRRVDVGPSLSLPNAPNIVYTATLTSPSLSQSSSHRLFYFDNLSSPVSPFTNTV